MATAELRVGLDANIVVAGIRWPRWPYEVLQGGIQGRFVPVLPNMVIDEARRHLPQPTDIEALDYFLAAARCEIVATPGEREIEANADLVRSKKDVPIALALLSASVDILVSLDRDFTDPDATAPRFRDRIRVMLPAVFLRDVLGWRSDELEAIRHRHWRDVVL